MSLDSVYKRNEQVTGDADCSVSKSYVELSLGDG